jgi:ERCC4-related helicase
MEQFEARSYQLEMLDQSLRQNIIVVMDTGSGKTHVYVQHYLEGPSEIVV